MLRCVLAGCLLWAVQGADGALLPEKSPLSEDAVAQRAREAAGDPAKLADLDHVSRNDARRVLKAVLKGHLARPGMDQDRLLIAVVKALPRAAWTPEQILDVLGAECPKTTARQIFYRRYREQWIFEHPIRCCVVFDCVKGKDSRVVAVVSLAAIP